MAVIAEMYAADRGLANLLWAWMRLQAPAAEHLAHMAVIVLLVEAPHVHHESHANFLYEAKVKPKRWAACQSKG